MALRPGPTTPEVDPNELARMQDGAKLANVLPQIEYEVGKMENGLITRVLSQIEQGEITAEAALNYWLELAAYRKLMKRLTTQTKIGQTVGERLKPHLEDSEGD